MSDDQPTPPDSGHDPPEPDLDLIEMVQRARRQFDSAAKPSDVAAVYWIEAHAPSDAAARPTTRAGQWVITATTATVDALWAQVKAATEAGRLGYKSKVATAPRRLQTDSDDRVLLVMVADADDTASVARVRAALVDLLGDVPLHFERA